MASSQPGAATITFEEEVDLQGATASGDGNSTHGGKSAQVEEELGLNSAGILLPCYKELVLASIHLASPRFHKGISRCPPKKLLKRTLADNIRVSCLHFFFVVHLSSFAFIIYPFASRAHIIH